MISPIRANRDVGTVVNPIGFKRQIRGMSRRAWAKL
jgi:hypothetical protein